MINVAFSFNPIRYGLSQVQSFCSFAAIASPTKGLKIPNEARASLADWLDMIDGKLLERKLLIAHQTMKFIKFTKVKPFGCSVRAACLSLSGAAKCRSLSFGLYALLRLLISSFGLFAFFRLAIAALSYTSFFSYGMPFLGFFSFFRPIVLFFSLLAFFRLLISLLGLPAYLRLLKPPSCLSSFCRCGIRINAMFTLILITVSIAFMFTKFFDYFCLFTFATCFHFFGRFGTSLMQNTKSPLDNKLRKCQPAQLAIPNGDVLTIKPIELLSNYTKSIMQAGNRYYTIQRGFL